ncbi:hypothetical protein B0H16DRAFT_1448733 [Mycena metata]|uniref:Uncharacterized protein n=1 Tax=Mycena metata TaxID=1033252 RepID=A0AAD7K8U3_9AGAR|nr:hypothetical protein B0H16DRAFT_1448733 [Mycena metata]
MFSPRIVASLLCSGRTLKCGAEALSFADPTSPTDGTLSLFSGIFSVASFISVLIECAGSLLYLLQKQKKTVDHIVELQFIADEISRVPGICAKFTTNPASLQLFFNVINAVPNLILVDTTVNNAKGIALGGKLFKDTTQKAAVNGAQNINPGTHVATTIDTAMTTVMGLEKAFNQGSKLDGTPRIKPQLASLIPATAPPAPGVIRSFVVRAITKSPAATTTQCPAPAKKPATTTSVKRVAQPIAGKAVVKPVRPVRTAAPKALIASAAYYDRTYSPLLIQENSTVNTY